MSSTGPNYPTSTTTSGSAPAKDFVNANNMQAADGVYSTTSASAGQSYGSFTLSCTGFGFAIPSDATITGIVVEIIRHASANSAFSWATDSSLKIIKGGTAGGTDKADTVTKYPTSDGTASYGSSSDLWGNALTPSDVNASNFGVQFADQGLKTGKNSGATASFDAIRMTVYWTPGPSQMAVRDETDRGIPPAPDTVNFDAFQYDDADGILAPLTIAQASAGWLEGILPAISPFDADNPSSDPLAAAFISSVTTSTVDQRAALWPEQPGYELSLQVAWEEPDVEDVARVDAPLYPAAAGALWEEQPGSESWLQPTWEDYGERAQAMNAPMNLTVASIGQQAVDWPEQPGSETSLQPVWNDADAAAVAAWVAIPNLTVASIDQQAAAWPEQPGSEASLQPTWYDVASDELAWKSEPIYPAAQGELYPEQPASDASLQPVWFDAGEHDWVFVPGSTAEWWGGIWPEQPASDRTVQPTWDDLWSSEQAPSFGLRPQPEAEGELWPEQPGNEEWRQPRWYDPEGIEHVYTFIPIFTGPNLDQRAALWPEQPGSEREVWQRWFDDDQQVRWPLRQTLGTRRFRGIQYHAIVFSPDANGGPGQPKLELDADILNLVWQQVQNGPGQAAFAMYRRSKKLDQLSFMRDHIKIIRRNAAGTERVVFAGKIVKPLVSASDVLIYCWDYPAWLSLSVTGYRVAYPQMLLGTQVVGPEFDLAKALTNSPFTFVAKGTIQDPLGLDGVTKIKTNAQFGMVELNRLFVFQMLAEMAMANTANNVKFEITREAPHTFNFWGNYGGNQSSVAFTSPGTLVAYDFDGGHDSQRFDLHTVLSDGAGGQAEYTVQAADANTSDYRRLQHSLAIRTLMGVNTNATETDQGIAALRRQLTVAARFPRSVTVQPRQGEYDPFAGHDVGDLFRHTIQRADQGGDMYDGYLRLLEVVGSWSPGHGELLQLRSRGAP